MTEHTEQTVQVEQIEEPVSFIEGIRINKLKQARKDLDNLQMFHITPSFNSSEASAELVRVPKDDGYLVIKYSTRDYNSKEPGLIYVTYERNGGEYPSTQRQIFRPNLEELKEAMTVLIIRLNSEDPTTGGAGWGTINKFIKKFNNISDGIKTAEVNSFVEKM